MNNLSDKGARRRWSTKYALLKLLAVCATVENNGNLLF